MNGACTMFLAVLGLAVFLAVFGLAGCMGGSETVGRDETGLAGKHDEAVTETTPAFCPRRVCEAEGDVRCHAWVRADANGVPVVNAAPTAGYAPADLQSAYAINPSWNANGASVAIINFGDGPNIESDLATYRAQFGLPACTTANRCFHKFNQRGETTNLPAANVGSAHEMTLDVEMVSAGCPGCIIAIVEADHGDFADTAVAMDTAAMLGATVISNSFSTSRNSEPADVASLAPHWAHPGVAIFASAGDYGYGTGLPAAFPTVIAVGGTSLKRTATGWTESAWGSTTANAPGTGSGCSTTQPKPPWQNDTGCAKRTVSDVSAVADPATGVAVYDSGFGGWTVVGGTSAAAPLVAAIFALTGHGKDNASLFYENPNTVRDVVGGVNGSCGGSYLCTAGTGYDGPTGLGSPRADVLAGLHASTAPDLGTSPRNDGGGPGVTSGCVFGGSSAGSGGPLGVGLLLAASMLLSRRSWRSKNGIQRAA
jgi:hypothetical protein